MGPKLGASKKQNTFVGSSSAYRPRDDPFNHSKFWGADHECRYRELAIRSIWSEKTFNIHPEVQFRDCLALIEGRNWKTFMTLPTSLNYEIIREFYANTLPIEGMRCSFTTMVRGRQVSFSKDVINEYLGNPLTLIDDELC